MDSEYVCFRIFVDLVFADFSNKQVVVDDFVKSNFYDLELYHGLLSGQIKIFDYLPDRREWQMERVLYSLWDTLTEVGGIKITTDIRDYTEPLDIGWKKIDLLKKLEDSELQTNAFQYLNGKRKGYAPDFSNYASMMRESPSPATVTVTMQPDKRLSAILDPNDSNHAPELALAVKLWLELYGRDEKTKHSHSHGADLFLQKQPFQSTAKERVKEITSPIKNWNKQRRKAFDEAQE